jgi:type I restriction enzyme M protein
MTKSIDIEDSIKDEVVLDDDQLVCALTGDTKKVTPKESILQSVILQMNEEYGFEMKDMQRDYAFSYEDYDGKKRRMQVDLSIFRPDSTHEIENITHLCLVHDPKVKRTDAKKGVESGLHNALCAAECDFGLWTNGDELHFCQRIEDTIGNEIVEDIADFPGVDETMDDLESLGERAQPRKPANDTLIRTFKRCHDYIYGNEGRKKDAFWELLNLIFCKIYDEKRRFLDAERNISYHREFWVGVKEQNTPEGQAAVAKRIKDIFEKLKTDSLFNEVFTGNEQISLSNRGIAYVAGEIAKYSFLDATVDVKGTAYETIVSNTLKQAAGQFFTPRNIIKCMVEIMNPTVNSRVLDPACGSGGFLVMVLDHVRHQIAHQYYPDKSEAMIDVLCNTEVINNKVREYAENMIFGFDFDPDLKKAAKMNMVMSGDGHSNIFNVNSLEYPLGSLPDVPRVGKAIQNSIAFKKDSDFDASFPGDEALGKFDMIFTNPPFGSKVQVAAGITDSYDLKAYNAPEVLFIEQCYRFLKPGGKMAIVLPDGILSNPNSETVRKWILERFKLIASIDLPVETFLPQVGVQASLLFLQKKSAIERTADISKESYDVFMAIAEMVGKDRRGVPVYEKDDDGAEILYNEKKEWATYNRQGELVTRSRIERVRRLADDLPKISAAYKEYLKGNL